MLIMKVFLSFISLLQPQANYTIPNLTTKNAKTDTMTNVMMNSDKHNDECNNINPTSCTAGS